MTTRRIAVRVLFPLACVLGLLSLTGCPPLLNLDDFMRLQMTRAGVPGLSACIVKGDSLVWSGGYGLANIEDQRPVTPDTMFMLASVSKTVTGTALMQLCEAGKVYLDDDINNYLPFEVRNPAFPDNPITLRMLMAHASSIRDNKLLLQLLYTQGDSPIALGDFIEGYLTPGGTWYNPTLNFHDYAPGGQWDYSNIGAALLGYLVEAISGQPFDQYCKDHIFQPLGMDHASWFLAGLDPTAIAMPYHRTRHGLFIPYGQYGYPDYPDGQLRVSVTEFAGFLGAYLNGGQWNGARILEPETIDEMFDITYPDLSGDQGLIWMYQDYGDNRAPSHGGADRGVSTGVIVIRQLDTAIAIFTNGEPITTQEQRAFKDIELRLIDEAEKY